MRAPFAQWRGPLPASNYSTSGMVGPIGVVVHHIDGPLAAAEAVFTNPATQRSAHFGIDFDGTVVQWVDTDHVAYAQCGGNWNGWVSIENANTDPAAPPTGEQVASMGQIIAWLGTPAVAATSPRSGGVGYHRQFPGPCVAGSDLWGQTDCPGDGFVAAIPAICAAARPAPTPFLEEDQAMIFTTDKTGRTFVWWRHGTELRVRGFDQGQPAKVLVVTNLCDPTNLALHYDATFGIVWTPSADGRLVRVIPTDFGPKADVI